MLAKEVSVLVEGSKAIKEKRRRKMGMGSGMHPKC